MVKIGQLLRGTKWGMITAILQRLVTFISNQAMMRLAGPEILGVAGIQFELLMNTLLSLSRDGLRLAVLKLPPVADHDTARQQQAIVNVSWLPFAVVLICCVVAWSTSLLELILEESSTDRRVASMYCMAACIMSAGEPFNNLFLHFADPVPQLHAETAGVVARCIVTVAIILASTQDATSTKTVDDATLLAFGYGQLAFAVAYLGALVLCAWRTQLLNASASFIPNSPIHLFHSTEQQLISLTGSTTLMSWVKHALTEADKIALTFVSSRYNQGIYAAASNYGSLVARVVFKPIEENARLLFARLAAEGRGVCLDVDAHTDGKQEARKMRTRSDVGKARHGRHSQKNEKGVVEVDILSRQASVLTGLMQASTAVGLCFACFGPPFVPCFVRVVLGSRWNTPETVSTLSAFCVYLLLLGLNGVSEAFVHAVFVPSQLLKVNSGLVLSSAAFALSVSPLISRYNSAGIVWANTVAYIVRVVWNARCIGDAFAAPKEYMGLQINATSSSAPSPPHAYAVAQWFSPLLHPLVGITLAISVALSYSSAHRFAASVGALRDVIEHGVLGVTFFGATAAVVWAVHRARIKSASLVMRRAFK